MRRGGIAEDFGHDRPSFVSFLHGYAHGVAVDDDVIGDVLAAGLHGLLCDHVFALLQQLFCQHATGDGLVDVRIYAADKVNTFYLLCSFKIRTVLSASSVKRPSEMM